MKCNVIQSIELDKLIAHQGNPNRMSASNFVKLCRNIERSGRYEPIVVRPNPGREGFFQIINGHHRVRALAKLGKRAVDAVVWDVNDEQADVLLSTLNRLRGTDKLDKKLEVLRRLNKRLAADKLAKILPQTRGQIERLVNLKLPCRVVNTKTFANPVVFFLTNQQQRVVTKAMTKTQGIRQESRMTKAQKNADAITRIARNFINQISNGA